MASPLLYQGYMKRMNIISVLVLSLGLSNLAMARIADESDHLACSKILRDQAVLTLKGYQSVGSQLQKQGKHALASIAYSEGMRKAEAAQALSKLFRYDPYNRGNNEQYRIGNEIYSTFSKMYQSFFTENHRKRGMLSYLGDAFPNTQSLYQYTTSYPDVFAKQPRVDSILSMLAHTIQIMTKDDCEIAFTSKGLENWSDFKWLVSFFENYSYEALSEAKTEVRDFYVQKQKVLKEKNEEAQALLASGKLKPTSQKKIEICEKEKTLTPSGGEVKSIYRALVKKYEHDGVIVSDTTWLDGSRPEWSNARVIKGSK